MTQKRWLVWALVLLFMMNIVAVSLAQQAEAAAYRQSSSGEQMRIIQTKLKNWGYHDGAVDGIYDGQTARAVKYFRRKNGLTVDSIAGPATLRTLGISSGSGGSDSQQNNAVLLARAISTEAWGEPYSGQVAAEAVALNRAEYPSLPNTTAGVVYQPGAFTCMVDGQLNELVADLACRATQDTFNGADPGGEAIHYFNPGAVTSAQIWSRFLVKTIDKHRFCVQ